MRFDGSRLREFSSSVGLFGIAVGTATIVAAVAAVVTLFMANHPSPAPLPSVPGTSVSTTPPGTPTTLPPTTSVQPQGEIFLADQSATAETGDIETGAVELGGGLYGHSIRYRCEYFCNDPQGVVEYNLGRRYRTFKATIGVADDTSDTKQAAVFEVHADGRRIGRYQVRFGQPEVVSLSVSGVLRLRLVAVEANIESPAQAGANIAGGVPNHLPDVAWGDARVTS